MGSVLLTVCPSPLTELRVYCLIRLSTIVGTEKQVSGQRASVLIFSKGRWLVRNTKLFSTYSEMHFSHHSLIIYQGGAVEEL